MKKIFYSAALCIMASFSFAQAPFQTHYENTWGFDGDHYSIETYTGKKYAYACAGTFFDGNKEIFHVFTTNEIGEIIWETKLKQFHGRILDIAISDEGNVAVTGFTGGIGAEEWM